MKPLLSFTLVFVGFIFSNNLMAQEEILFLRGQDLAKSKNNSTTTVTKGAPASEMFMVISPKYQRAQAVNQQKPAQNEGNESLNDKTSTPVTQNQTTNANTSSSNTQTAQKPVNRTPEEELIDEDSVLSYNFLYMLIKNFKVSEIVE